MPHGNWVDRGEPAAPQLVTVLAFLFDLHDEPARSWLESLATQIVGMVDARTTEVDVARFLKDAAEARGLARPAQLRMAATALWHIAMVARVRDGRGATEGRGVG